LKQHLQQQEKKYKKKEGNPKSLLGISVIFVILVVVIQNHAFIHHSFHSFIVH